MKLVHAFFLLCLLVPLPGAAVSSPAEMLPDHAQELRAEQIGGLLRCMVCQNQTIEDSDADLARDLRHIVRQRVVAGDSDRQIMGFMTDRYGDFVRMRPPFRPLTWALWFSPLLALAAGLLVVIAVRRRPATRLLPLNEAEQARLNSLLHP